MLADLVLDKYLDHLPLYRIEQRFWRLHGVKVPRHSLSDALAQIAQLATPIVQAIEHALWAGSYIQADETPIRCLDPARPGGSYRGWLWTITSPPGSDVIFRWAESRGHEFFKDWLPEDFRGVVQRDGNAAYVAVARRHSAQITWAGCSAHVRRKFFEASEAGDRTAKWFLGQIGLLYAVERSVRACALSPKLRQRERAITSVIVLARLHRAFRRLAGRLRPKSLLGQAITYALGQWSVLEVFRERGEIDIDNNRVENAIRPTPIGKKNWLFIGANRAGSKSAALYSLIGSCLQRGLNPREDLHWLFSRLTMATNQTVAQLTPAAFATLKAGNAAGSRPTLRAA